MNAVRVTRCASLSFIGRYELHKAIRERGIHEVFVTDLLHESIQDNDGDAIQLGMSKHYLFQLRAARKVRRIAKEIAIDIVHDHHFSLTPWLVSRKLMGRTDRQKAVITLHTSLIGQVLKRHDKLRRHRLYLIIHEFLSSHYADGIVAVTSGIVEDIKRYYGIRQDKIGVIPNGVNTDLFRPTLIERSELGFSSSDRILLFVGLIYPGKGVDDILKAMTNLGENVKIVLVGGVLEDTQEYIMALADRLGRDRVFFRPKVCQPELVMYYSMADLFVFPSRWEGAPKVILEALACACPVVATPLPGIKQIDPQGDFITFCQERDSADLAQKILYLLDDSPERDRRAARGLEEVKDRYTWDHIASQHVEFYEQLLGK